MLNYLPAPNLPGTTQNYRLLTTSGTNTDNFGVRWNHSFGPSTGNIPAIARQFINTGTGLNQSINANFNYSHSASDDINLFPTSSAASSRPTATPSRPDTPLARAS